MPLHLLLADDYLLPHLHPDVRLQARSVLASAVTEHRCHAAAAQQPLKREALVEAHASPRHRIGGTANGTHPFVNNPGVVSRSFRERDRSALDRLQEQQRTIVIIAHRSQLIERCDCVIRLENGRIVEMAEHA